MINATLFIAHGMQFFMSNVRAGLIRTIAESMCSFRLSKVIPWSLKVKQKTNKNKTKQQQQQQQKVQGTLHDVLNTIQENEFLGRGRN